MMAHYGGEVNGLSIGHSETLRLCTEVKWGTEEGL
jgi:hypothetical protein